VIPNRLLILDDDPMIGQTMAYIARSMGVEAHTTTSASEFFNQVSQWQPDRIAVDLVMPDMDGVEVLVELARLDCRAQIIITSGVGARVLDAARRSAAEHGLNILGILSKPFSPSALRQLLVARPVGDPAPTSTNGNEDLAEPIGIEELSDALASREFELAFQPKVYCTSGILAGFEALARWRSPQRGMVMPGDFIPLVENGGLIDALTQQVIDMALDWFAEGFAECSQNDEAPLTLSINLSARTLGDGQFIDKVSHRCENLNIAPDRLIFELTETSAMEDPVASLDLLTRLRMKGFQLSIDDFGTGYSSMLQLVRLPFSEIKVDRSFVMSAMRSEESLAVIRSVVELGHSLGLRTTAEGVEDAPTLDLLKQLRCDLAQGYYIARPLTGRDAMAWARNH
jgi:EAL domain-containing protein (putative c-di-GMP-specific phosphodiesterase class I)/DNA-binding NarL/FixJ family response regulator